MSRLALVPAVLLAGCAASGRHAAVLADAYETLHSHASALEEAADRYEAEGKVEWAEENRRIASSLRESAEAMRRKELAVEAATAGKALSALPGPWGILGAVVGAGAIFLATRKRRHAA